MKKLLAGIFLVLVVLAWSHHKDILEAFTLFENYTHEMPFLGAVLLIFLKIVSSLLGLPGTPLTLLSGSLFGKIFGTLISLIGNILGASCAFLLARYLLRDYVIDNLVTKYPALRKYDGRLKNNAVATVITLRLIPLFPFNALNFLCGVTSISFKDYILGTSIGIIPGTFIFVYFGESLRMLHPLNVALAVLGVIGLSIFGNLYGNYYEKRK